MCCCFLLLGPLHWMNISTSTDFCRGEGRWQQLQRKEKGKMGGCYQGLASFFSAECFCCLIAIETKKELLLATVGRQKQKTEKHPQLKWRFLFEQEEGCKDWWWQGKTEKKKKRIKKDKKLMRRVNLTKVVHMESHMVNPDTPRLNGLGECHSLSTGIF